MDFTVKLSSAIEAFRRGGGLGQDNGGRVCATGTASLLFWGSFEEHAQGVATREKVLSPPNASDAQGADGAVRFRHRSGDKEPALAERGARVGGSVMTDVTNKSGNSAPPDGLGDSMRATRSSKTGQGNGGRVAATGTASSLFGRSFGEHAQGVATREKVLSPPDASDAQGADGAVRFRHRSGDKEAALAEKGAGPGGHAAAVETGESSREETVGGFVDATRAVRGGESQQDKGNNGAASGIAASTLRTGLVERVHPPVTSENAASLPSPFTAAVVDTVPIAPGFDTGERISSAGRAVLMTQVIEASQPLMQHGGGRILISLNPPSLGALDIDVRVKKDNVELFVIANNQDVQQTLCFHVEQLRKALVDQGLNMDRFQVVVGDHSGSQQGRDTRQEGTSGWQGESRGDSGYRPEADGENASEGMPKAMWSGAYPSVGGINVFI
jgi:hypothetical protein